MSDIRYVVLSDLHFGAQNSLLTNVEEHQGAPTLAEAYVTKPGRPSALLEPVFEGLRSLVGNQEAPPNLILAGDVLDLALSTDAVACTAFGSFVDLAFGGGTRLFSPMVYYLPGNHDHHVWETAREAQYRQYLRQTDVQEQLVEPWHTTPLSTDDVRLSDGDLLSTLIQRRPGCRDVAVRVKYPNLALRSGDGKRTCIITHGHYTEPIYMLMSALKDILFPDQAPGPGGYTVDRMEAENFAWIDFFWSTLGRSGEVGSDVGLVYADLTSAHDLSALSANLTRTLVARSHGHQWMRPVESRVATSIAQREVRHLARTERGTPGVTLSPSSSLGAKKYLAGPVLHQIRAEFDTVGEDVSFVFGHTHKPFVDSWDVTGYPGKVVVHNTGGWVVDTALPAPTQGAGAVLIDDDLNVASLQLYRQGPDGVAVPPLVLDEAGESPLHDLLARCVDGTREPWSAIGEVATELIGERHRLQAATNRFGT